MGCTGAACCARGHALVDELFCGRVERLPPDRDRNHAAIARDVFRGTPSYRDRPARARRCADRRLPQCGERQCARLLRHPRADCHSSDCAGGPCFVSAWRDRARARPRSHSGAAAASGKLLALTTVQLVWALGMAATQAAGLCECLGTPAKSVHVGNAARNGLWSAMLAARGIAGPREPLAGDQGYFHALNETPQLSFLTDGLGSNWEIVKTAYKPYPCGFVVHPVLDCVLDWRRQHADAVVDKVTVIGNPLLAARTDRPNISTSGQSQVSVQHAVAAALVTGKAGVEQFGEA